MERNVCGPDRVVRLVAGTALALVAFRYPRNRRERDRPGAIARWRIPVAYAAGELLLTGLQQWCPMNYLLGVDTCEEDWRTALRSVRRRVAPRP